MRDQVKQAQAQHHDGVIAIHWRTEETRTTFEAFARFAFHPGDTSSVTTIYRTFLERECGVRAAEELAPVFARCDEEGWFRSASSPEYYAYTPQWGRLDPQARVRLLDLIATIGKVAGTATVPQQAQKLAWYIADCRFMLLLDEVGRKLEPVWLLRKRTHAGGPPHSASSGDEVTAARNALAAAPLNELFSVYASRVRSRGELGVLSSLNQKLYNEYADLLRFIATQ